MKHSNNGTVCGELKFENVDSVCRSCLAADAQFNIFLCMYEEENLATVLQGLFFDTTENLDNDKMPQHMCEKCISELISVCEFKRQYRRSQSLLENIILCSSEEPVAKDDLEVFTIIKDENDVSESEANNLTEDVDNFVIKEESVKDEKESLKIIANDLIKDEKVEDETLNNGNNEKYIQCYKSIKHNCKPCGITFANREEYLKHRQETKHKWPRRKYPCEYCGRIFTKNTLTNHIKIHTAEKSFECSQCSSRFSEKQNLHRHMKIHTGEKPYICEFCGKGFIQKNHLIDHRNRRHTGERPYMCEFCGKTYVDSQQCKEHLLIHTKDFIQDHSLDESQATHRRRELLTKVKRFQCNVCLKRFSAYSCLYTHSTIHKGLKPYECDICQMRFRQKQQLKSHARTHTGEKPHNCQYCGKSFNRVGNLTVHVRIHTGEKPYKCEHCDKGYADLNGLKKHRKKHEDSEEI